LPPLSYPSPP